MLTVLYLIYNAGADDVHRAALRREAIRLGRVLVDLMPNEPETTGLLALLLLNESRIEARTAGDGRVLLADQDRSRWDRSLIRQGLSVLQACSRHARPGPFQLQAAIQAVHCQAESVETTDWPRIVALYDLLYSQLPTPVVALNRAIALAEAVGPQSGLEAMEAVASDLSAYHLLHAARAATLLRLGRRREACDAYQRALTLAPTDSDRRFLRARIELVAEG